MYHVHKIAIITVLVWECNHSSARGISWCAMKSPHRSSWEPSLWSLNSESFCDKGGVLPWDLYLHPYGNSGYGWGLDPGERTKTDESQIGGLTWSPVFAKHLCWLLQKHQFPYAVGEHRRGKCRVCKPLVILFSLACSLKNVMSRPIFKATSTIA